MNFDDLTKGPGLIKPSLQLSEEEVLKRLRPVLRAFPLVPDDAIVEEARLLVEAVLARLLDPERSPAAKQHDAIEGYMLIQGYSKLVDTAVVAGVGRMLKAEIANSPAHKDALNKVNSDILEFTIAKTIRQGA